MSSPGPLEPPPRVRPEGTEHEAPNSLALGPLQAITLFGEEPRVLVASPSKKLVCVGSVEVAGALSLAVSPESAHAHGPLLAQHAFGDAMVGGAPLTATASSTFAASEPQDFADLALHAPPAGG